MAKMNETTTQDELQQAKKDFFNCFKYGEK